MSAPDNLIIAQVSLLCDGYKHAKKIGKKLVELFEFCEHSLSKQNHYDWGLRALKTVLGSCGTLFRMKNCELREKEEMETAVEAVRFNTLSKLTFSDAKMFDRLVNDVFLGVDFVKIGFEELSAALAEACDELGLQHIDRQVSIILVIIICFSGDVDRSEFETLIMSLLFQEMALKICTKGVKHSFFN